MRRWYLLAWLAAACATSPPPPPYYGPPPDPQPAEYPPPAIDLARDGRLENRSTDFQFDGGQLDFEMYRLGNRVFQTVRSRYMVPITIAWTMSGLENLRPVTPTTGAILVPPAAQALGNGPLVVLAELERVDSTQGYRREIAFHARFGDPDARPVQYHYALPYPRGQTFSVLQGFHGAFSHRGSNEYAIDFDCPVATPVLATRPGIVVAANATAQGSGTTPEFLEYKRTNFVIVMHDDGSLGEYMHLSPSSVQVKPGQSVDRGEQLALSGNTGFSSTPHLHFQVMTAARDGIAAHSFPFEMAVAPNRIEEPELAHRYTGWETRSGSPPMR